MPGYRSGEPSALQPRRDSLPGARRYACGECGIGAEEIIIQQVRPDSIARWIMPVGVPARRPLVDTNGAPLDTEMQHPKEKLPQPCRSATRCLPSVASRICVNSVTTC